MMSEISSFTLYAAKNTDEVIGIINEVKMVCTEFNDICAFYDMVTKINGQRQSPTCGQRQICCDETEKTQTVGITKIVNKMDRFNEIVRKVLPQYANKRPIFAYILEFNEEDE